MSRTLTVEGDLGTVDARASLTTQGSVTAPSRVVPSGVTKIQGIIAAAAADGSAEGAAVYIVRLGGSAVLGGEQTFVVGGSATNTAQSGSDTAPDLGSKFMLMDADIDVRPGDVINIDAEEAGIDIGDASIVVTLIYGA